MKQYIKNLYRDSHKTVSIQLVAHKVQNAYKHEFCLKYYQIFYQTQINHTQRKS